MSSACSCAITDGWTRYSSSYTVQNRTSASLSERFSYANGIWQTRVYAGEERVEMRWAGWSVQTRDNMWDGDINFMPVTAGVKVLPQALAELWEMLTDALRSS